MIDPNCLLTLKLRRADLELAKELEAHELVTHLESLLTRLEDLESKALDKAKQVATAQSAVDDARRAKDDANRAEGAGSLDPKEFMRLRDHAQFCRQAAALCESELRQRQLELSGLESRITQHQLPKDRVEACRVANAVASIVLRSNDPAGVGLDLSRIAEMTSGELLWRPIAEHAALAWYRGEYKLRTNNSYIPVALGPNDPPTKPCPEPEELERIFRARAANVEAEHQRKLSEARALLAAG